MINRRQFLQQMLCAAGVAAAPKFIFDVGANLWKQKPTATICTDCNYAELLAYIRDNVSVGTFGNPHPLDAFTFPVTS